VIFRRRFAELIERQLDLFAQDEAELLEEIEKAERAYDDAAREEAEERFGEYSDLVAEGTERLAEIRDNYAASLDEETAAEYEAAFNQAVLRRFAPLALELEDEEDD
jgi:hypothetical protein